MADDVAVGEPSFEVGHDETIDNLTAVFDGCMRSQVDITDVAVIRQARCVRPLRESAESPVACGAVS